MRNETNLSKEDIRLIRELAYERLLLRAKLNALSNKSIANKFNTSETTVSSVINHTYSYGSAK